MRNKKQILAIDPATKTGWAHTCGASGVWDLSLKADESSGMRLVRFEGKLLEILDTIGADIIVYEGARYNSGRNANSNAFKLVSKLEGIIEKICEEEGYVECKNYNISQIKSHAGAKKKEEILQKAKEKWSDRIIADDNEADALWLLDLAMKDLYIDHSS